MHQTIHNNQVESMITDHAMGQSVFDYHNHD